MRAHVSQSLQRLISTDGYGRRVINRAWNGVKNDVKDDQKDDPADSSTASICAGHENASFSSLISVSS
jgi:hypothetical protein